jgi:hypothetical protein
MAKDETASRSAEVPRAYARYTINLQRAFNGLLPKLKRAYGQPACDAADTRSQHVLRFVPRQSSGLSFVTGTAPHPLALLRARRERPSDCRAAEQRDEIASFHVWMAPAWQEKM